MTAAIAETSAFGILLYLGVQEGQGREYIFVPWSSIRLIQSNHAEVLLPSEKMKLGHIQTVVKP